MKTARKSTLLFMGWRRSAIAVVVAGTILPCQALAADSRTGKTADEAAAAQPRISKDAAECRKIAHDRVQDTPAVRSGLTTYLPDGARPYYQSCMAGRGHEEYPPY